MKEMLQMNKELEKLIQRYPELSSCVPEMEQAFTIMKDSFANSGKLLVCGNGGSAADCEHIVGELMKGFMLQRAIDASLKERLKEIAPDELDYFSNHLQRALPAISLVSHSALMTAFSNDEAPDLVFAQQVLGYGNSGDVLLGISTSGNSKNVLSAIKVAKAKGLKTIGLTGRSGGKLKDVCDVTIKVPFDSTPAIQERHLPIYHSLCIMIEEEFFGNE
jgi:phosphoheptose isomerase